MTNKPPTKAELLEKIHTARKQFKALIDSLTETQIITPGVQENWSVKDILAHLTAWERMTLERLNSGLSNRPSRIRPIHTNEEVDWMNEKVHAIHQDRPLVDILDDFQTSFERLMEKVEGLNKNVFQNPTSMEWAGDRPVWLLIADNTYLHYAEHREAIEKGLVKKDEG